MATCASTTQPSRKGLTRSKLCTGNCLWLCVGVTASSLCFGSLAYMSFPRHMMLAFPLSILAALWSVERGRARFALEAMALGSLILCAAFLRHGWVP